MDFELNTEELIDVFGNKKKEEGEKKAPPPPKKKALRLVCGDRGSAVWV